MITIRSARIEDAQGMLDIYRPYVEHTAITFEWTVPSPEEFRERIGKTLSHYPCLVAEENGELCGYAMGGRFHERRAYDWCSELSSYVREDMKRKGIGRKLYAALEERLCEAGFVWAYACIGVPHEERDPYLTFDSVRFHERMGYETCGRFETCGLKFSRWYDMVYMQKRLNMFPERVPHEGDGQAQ
ncbi:MAG: N-acetyltransferase [Clostridia bacterium]|nr:N-acetyltransferase [Clostridia bacterium]